MSINLHVEDYCQNCPDFEADVIKMEMSSVNASDIIHTDIYCECRYKCKCLKEHLKGELR